MQYDKRRAASAGTTAILAAREEHDTEMIESNPLCPQIGTRRDGD